MSTLMDVLAPVTDALWQAAGADAGAIRAAGERDARRTLAGARADAARILDDARRDGAQAAEELAAGALAGARHQARERVLAARRAAYDTLRLQAIDALRQQASTPAGRRLTALLRQLVAVRVGAPAAGPVLGDHRMSVVAEARNRRASVTAEDLVDRALAALRTEVSFLWA